MMNKTDSSLETKVSTPIAQSVSKDSILAVAEDDVYLGKTEVDE